jgi:hypothetical protein
MIAKRQCNVSMINAVDPDPDRSGSVKAGPSGIGSEYLQNGTDPKLWYMNTGTASLRFCLAKLFKNTCYGT